MSSFIEKLRMNNIYPTGGMNLGFGGQLQQYGEPDPLEDVLNRYRGMVGNARQSIPVDNGGGSLRKVASRVAAPEAPQQLRFGGVTGDSNPGADILRRATGNAERLYDSYSKPQITSGEILRAAGIKPNDQDPGFTKAVENLDVDKQLNADLKRSQTEENKARTAEINNRENLTEDKAWKVITITDPSNPTRQINARYNSITNKVEPITMPNNGIITTTTKQGELLKERDKQDARAQASKSFLEKAQAALDTLNELSDEGGVDAEGKPTDKLKPNTQTATGYSANIPFLEYIPGETGTGAAAAHASIERLRNLLTLDLLQEIKKQSSSGATGFGQMNLRELGVLENSASKLAKMNQDEPSYARELNRIRTKLTEILSQKGGFTGPEGDTGTEDNTTTDTNAAPAVNAQTPPPAPAGWEYVRNGANNGWTARPKGSK